MKTYKITSKEIKNIGDIVLALGFFDGLHLGHQKIINKAMEIAKQKKLKSAVLTFTKAPRDVIAQKASTNVFGILDKKNLLAEMGLDYLIVLDLTKADFKNTSAQAFVNYYLEKMGSKIIVCGQDFRFGKNGLGKPLDIEKYSNNKVSVVVEKLQTIQAQKISSTSLKKYLKNNNLIKVKTILGRDFCVYGIVSHGHKVGRELGFKTANININDDFAILLNGVFAVRVKHNNISYYGVANVGTRPTFVDRNQKQIEVFMFNFNNKIYNQEIKIEFIKFIRSEKAFSSPDKLSQQIRQDIAQVKKYFKLK